MRPRRRGSRTTFSTPRTASMTSGANWPANRGEPELQASLVLATWASDLADLEARCQQLQAHFAAGEYGLARPTGAQLDLFAAMLPASGTPRVARDYAQYLLPRDLAGGAPFTGTARGPAGCCSLRASTPRRARRSSSTPRAGPSRVAVGVRRGRRQPRQRQELPHQARDPRDARPRRAGGRPRPHRARRVRRRGGGVPRPRPGRAAHRGRPGVPRPDAGPRRRRPGHAHHRVPHAA